MNIFRRLLCISEALIDLLQTVVDIDGKCCHSTHLSFILSAYTATLSTSGKSFQVFVAGFTPFVGFGNVYTVDDRVERVTFNIFKQVV